MRAQRIAKGLCVTCGKRQQFWGIRCVICRERYAQSPLPGSLLKAIRHHRRADSREESKQIREKIRAASRVLLNKGLVSGKEALALKLYVGLDGGQWRTYREVAKIMNVSFERIRQLLVPAKSAMEAALGRKIPWRHLASTRKRPKAIRSPKPLSP